MFKMCGVIGAVLLLTACGVPKARQETGHGAIETVTPALPPGAAAYRIDPVQSELRLLVHRAGPMARLGHNHVIVNRSLGGWLRFAGDAATASFSLTVPVADFVVDDARMRIEAGADFSEDVPEDAKSGTRHNMLGAALLDADHYPTITLTSVSVTGQSPLLTAKLNVNVAGHQSTLLVPFTLETAAGRVSASGTTILRQTALGLAPISVMLGALQVQDELSVQFKLIAVTG